VAVLADPDGRGLSLRSFTLHFGGTTMRRLYHTALALAAVMLIPRVGVAQAQMEASRGVAGGGISVPAGRGRSMRTR